MRKLKLLLLLTAALGAAVGLPLWTSSNAQEKPDYGRFTHKTHTGAVKLPGSQETRELKCDACHERLTARQSVLAANEHNRRLQLNFPGHKACVECHITQFTKRPLQTCGICHQQEQGLTARPPQRDFPARRDYNAFFDGKQHVDHVNKYAQADGKKMACVDCHKPTAKQAALTIPAHAECYVCHTSGSGDAKAALKADCSVCHTQMIFQAIGKTTGRVEPFSAKYTSRAFGALFSHRTHVAYAGNSCAACHTLEGKYNQPLAAPSKIRVKEHLSPGERSGRGCFSCHDGGKHYGRAAFSGEDAGACIKCHKTQDKNGTPLVRPTQG